MYSERKYKIYHILPQYKKLKPLYILFLSVLSCYVKPFIYCHDVIISAGVWGQQPPSNDVTESLSTITSLNGLTSNDVTDPLSAITSLNGFT
jgi:hypothetical protein